MSEKMLLQKYGVTVTSARAIFTGNTYPISGITAVGKRRIRPNNEFTMAVGAICSLAGALVAGVGFANSSGQIIAVSLPFLIIGVGLFLYARSMPMIHAVTVSTAGGQMQVFRSLDVDHAEEVHDAIVLAVIAKS